MSNNTHRVVIETTVLSTYDERRAVVMEGNHEACLAKCKELAPVLVQSGDIYQTIECEETK